MNTRQRWLALVLILTVAAAFWPLQEPVDEVVAPNRQARALAGDGVPAGGSVQAASRQDRITGMQADLFPVQSWVPPPPPPKPHVPPPPAPPPLPFKYLGRWVEQGQETLFLVQGDLPIPVQSGQVLSGGWRVERITETAVVFTYLPLNMQSILGITP